MANSNAPALDLSALAETKVAEIETVKQPVNVPDEVKAFVDAAHEFWKEHPKRWREVNLKNGEVAQQVRKLAVKYCQSTGRTFRVNKKAMERAQAGTLIYKVTDAVKHSDSQEASE